MLMCNVHTHTFTCWKKGEHACRMAYKAQCNSGVTEARQLDTAYKPPMVLSELKRTPPSNPDDPTTNAQFPFQPTEDVLLVLELRRPGAPGPSAQFTQSHDDDTADVYIVEDTPNGPNSMLVAFNMPLAVLVRGNIAPIHLSSQSHCVSSITYIVKWVACGLSPLQLLLWLPVSAVVACCGCVNRQGAGCSCGWFVPGTSSRATRTSNRS